MSVKISRADISTVEIVPLPGSLKSGASGNDASEALAPNVRRAKAVNGSCEIALDSLAIDVEAALALASPCGVAAAAVEGDAECLGALIDVAIKSQDGILTAGISWNGFLLED